MLTRYLNVSLAFVLAVSSVVGACGRCPRTPAFAYEGERRPPSAAGVLPRLDAVPLGFEVLGNVSAHCERTRPRADHVEMALGTLLCSAQSLTSVLEEMAREAGGTALVGTRCNRTGSTDSAPAEDSGTYYECSAQVLAPRLAEGTASTKSASFTTPGRARLWSLARVEFDAMAPLGEPWPSATEVPVLPIADRRLGLLRVTVGAGGALEDARQATFDAAAALGANHVVAPSCTPAKMARLSTCVAWVSAPEHDPRREAMAR